MALPPFRPLTSWSYSRYSLYKQCPLKFYLSVIKKLPEPKGTALQRGVDVHNAVDAYLKGVTAKMPAELATFSVEAKRLRAKRKKDPDSMIIEDNWAFTKDWGPSRWDDWNNCYLRVKVDVAERTGNHIQLTDWKTGKYRPDNHADYVEQLELYQASTLTVFAHVPDLRVTARLLYLDADKIHPTETEVTQADLPRLQKLWSTRVKPMFADKRFAPRPNQFCRFCHFRKDNAGPCKY